MSCSIQVDTAAFSTNMFPTEIFRGLIFWGSLDFTDVTPLKVMLARGWAEQLQILVEKLTVSSNTISDDSDIWEPCCESEAIHLCIWVVGIRGHQGVKSGNGAKRSVLSPQKIPVQRMVSNVSNAGNDESADPKLMCRSPRQTDTVKKNDAHASTNYKCAVRENLLFGFGFEKCQ